ncbi:MAG: response regulator [Planctomycetes bacterium]|nr:response regulator [Planctomycetota bacterium]
MNHKILVIDDDSGIREFLRETLSKLGYRVFCAQSGEEAVETATRNTPDLAICDVVMPNMDGLETLNRLKKLNTDIPVIMISGVSTHEMLINAINQGALDFISKPFSLIQIKQVIKQALNQRANKPADGRSPMTHLMREGYLTLLSMVNTMLEIKNSYLRNHSQKVAEHSHRIAMAMKLPDEQVEVIHYAALLHDIGKVGVNDAVLLKPGKLDEYEWLDIKSHPLIGRSMIEPIKLFRAEEPLIYHHHEWFDGTGYPDKLGDEKIPLGARIISIADAYDAMTSERPYRKAMVPKTALKIIEESCGKQFDPKIGKTFISIVKE